MEVKTNDFPDTNDLEYYSFIGQSKECKICSVIDGDTVKFIHKVDGKYYLGKGRLKNLSVPKIKPKKNNTTAIKAKSKLNDLIYNKVVTIVFSNVDNKGRHLIEIYNKDEETSVNDIMLKEPYVSKFLIRK